MATYTVSAGHKGLGPWSLVASQVDIVSFASNVSDVVIINDGAGDVWYTTDGTTPSVPGAHVSTTAMRVPAGMFMDVNLSGGSDEIRMVSSGTPTVSVQLAK